MAQLAEDNPAVIGLARVDRRTKHLLLRIQPGEIAIIDLNQQLTNGTNPGTSRVSLGSRVMKNAPMIEPEIVPTPPISTIAMYCTDSSRLNEPGSKKPLTV